MFIPLDELCESSEFDIAEAIVDLTAKGVWVFDAGSNGQSDLVYVTTPIPTPHDREAVR